MANKWLTLFILRMPGTPINTDNFNCLTTKETFHYMIRGYQLGANGNTDFIDVFRLSLFGFSQLERIRFIAWLTNG